jgi:hypothetical protein
LPPQLVVSGVILTYVSIRLGSTSCSARVKLIAMAPAGAEAMRNHEHQRGIQ